MIGYIPMYLNISTQAGTRKSGMKIEIDISNLTITAQISIDNGISYTDLFSRTISISKSSTTSYRLTDFTQLPPVPNVYYSNGVITNLRFLYSVSSIQIDGGSDMYPASLIMSCHHAIIL